MVLACLGISSLFVGTTTGLGRFLTEILEPLIPLDTLGYPWIPLDTFGYPWIPLWLSCEPWRRAPGKLGAPPSEEASETFGSKTYLAGVGNKLTKHLLEYWDVNNGKRGQTSHLWEKNGREERG